MFYTSLISALRFFLCRFTVHLITKAHFSILTHKPQNSVGTVCVGGGVSDLWGTRNTIVLRLGAIILCGGGILNFWISTPPRAVSLSLLDSGFSVVFPVTNMHAMMQGISSYMHMCNYFPTRLQTSNYDSYKRKLRTEINRAPNFLEGSMFILLQHEGQFIVRESHEKVAIAWYCESTSLSSILSDTW